MLISPTPLRELPNVLPPGLVLATLAYLASRLILVSAERQKLVGFVHDHAARILQAAWRRRQNRREHAHFRLLSPSKNVPLKTYVTRFSRLMVSIPQRVSSDLISILPNIGWFPTGLLVNGLRLLCSGSFYYKERSTWK